MENNQRKHKRLSITELKSFRGFVNYTNEQAEEVIKALEKLSVLFFELFQKNKSMYSSLNNQHYDITEQRNAA